jgi:hypothetical protein
LSLVPIVPTAHWPKVATGSPHTARRRLRDIAGGHFGSTPNAERTRARRERSPAPHPVRRRASAR